jgi:hypothetical protein
VPEKLRFLFSQEAQAVQNGQNPLQQIGQGLSWVGGQIDTAFNTITSETQNFYDSLFGVNTQLASGNSTQLNGQSYMVAETTTNPNYAAKMLGYDRDQFGEMIHALKENEGIPPNGNLTFHSNGDVYYSGEYCGNINDYCN